MENEKISQTEGESSSVYIIGAVIVVAVIIAGVLLWPKPKVATPVSTTTPAVEEKTAITKLACEKQWYNPVIGFAKYYLSAEGVALNTTKGVTCTFTVTSSSDGKVMATEDMPAVLRAADERGGQMFQCTTKAIELTKGAAVTLKTAIKDDQGATASCTPGAMVLP